MRIEIRFRELPPGKRPPSMRFVCMIFLSTLPDRPFNAVIDTGAPFSIVPWNLWRDGAAMIESLGDYPDWRNIRGIAGGGVPCEFGRIGVMLADATPARSGWLSVSAQLARSDHVPLILGVAGFLDTYELVLNRDGAGYIVVAGA